MDVYGVRHRHPCWVCDGAGRTVIREGGELVTCEMCDGTGMVDALPKSSAEMAGMLAAMPSVSRRTLTPAEIAEAEELAKQLADYLREIDEE